MNKFTLLYSLCFVAAILMGSALAGCGPTVPPDTGKEAPSSRGAEVSIEDRDPNRLWCKEHSTYEDECLICHPELKDKKKPKVEEPDPGLLLCKEHGVYEDQCFVCHPEIKPSPDDLDPARLFCKEHGVYEDTCFLCHPELKEKLKKAPQPKTEKRDPDRLWCKEHDVYEDECDKCHPELKDKKKGASAASADNSKALMCKEHGVPELECGICHSDRLANMAVGDGMKVRFASGASTSKAGVEMGNPATSSGGAGQQLLGQVSFNRNKLAMVTPLGGGVVTEVLKDVGDMVEAGDVLATVQSPDIAEARSEYLKVLAEGHLTQQTLAREQDLHKREISARQDLEQAQAAAAVADAAVAESKQHLLNLGLSKDELAAVASEGATSSMQVRAPFAGTIIERTAVMGTAVEPGDALFTVADLSSMWMQLSVPEAELSSMQVGALVQARFEAYPGVAFEGEISWVAPTVNADTRMLEVRAILANPQGLLKEGLFGRASLAGFAQRAGVTVPADAVQDVDGKAVVFRKLEDDLFETRLIETGGLQDGSIAILAGLAPDDEIVTQGSYIMKSELLKARLGAGCTDD